MVSQWPIAPGYYFDYEIKPEVGDAGTYFYHSHVGFQQLTAHGALLVEERNARQAQEDHGEDIVLVLGDYYAKDDATIEAGLLADPFQWSGEPQAVLMQGRSGTMGFDNATDDSCKPYVIDVEPGTIYRLRVIGATALSLVKVGIEGHDELRVIEADGGYTRPVPIDHIQVAPGQRFSYQLRTKTEREIEAAGTRHFWLRYETRERPESIKGYALLRYRKPRRGPRPAAEPQLALPAEPPVALPLSTSDYLEYTLEPRLRETRDQFPPAESVTRTVTIQINQKLTSGALVDDSFDGSLDWV